MSCEELPRPTLPTVTMKERVKCHLHNWCDDQDLSTQPELSRNYTTHTPFMEWNLREDIALYSTKVTTIITEQTLLNSVSGLKTWNAQETHLSSLCHFLNGILKKVHIDHGGARIMEHEQLEQRRARKGAREPFPFLRLPYDIRVRVYDFLIAEKHSREYHLSYRKSITVPRDQHSDLFHRRLAFNLTQVNTQFRREFLPRWHHAVGLRFAITPHEDLKEIEAWLETFGATRIPLTRCFDFEFGHDIVRVELRGAQSWTLSGYRLKITDIGVAQKDKIKTSSPDGLLTFYCCRARKEREPGFELALERFVKPLLMETGRQSVQLTVEGVARIIEYLQQRAIADNGSKWNY